MIQKLFDEKLVEEEAKKVILTDTQKQQANRWIENIKSGKLEDEKQNYTRFQDTILREILGYNLSEDLEHEKGNIEFVIHDIAGKDIIGIEAKGTKSGLNDKQSKGYKEWQKTPLDQLWNYMGHLNLKYGIVTNYREFILIDKNEALNKYHLFDFLDIEKNADKLKEFVYIFCKSSLLDTKKVEELKEESKNAEREFTKEFYKIFHETRLMILKEFKETGINEELAIHYSQLFLNRLMFIFFAEDRGLLEKNFFEKTIFSLLENGGLNNSSYNVLDNISDIFEQLDNKIPLEIHGFNGELFKEKISRDASFRDFRSKEFFEDYLQNSKLKTKANLSEAEKAIFVKYQDKLSPIIQNILIMASFDFQNQVNVEILGHIFEQSISDLEELKKDGVSKRRKEGVFYTPEYITDYICRNTIIPYLSTSGTNNIKTLIKEHERNIEELEIKFRNIKILDPACGSGAFLIKSVDIMIEIFDEIQRVKQDFGEYSKQNITKRGVSDNSQLNFKKFEEQDEIREIIEKNIFGVDINEESVEITKLALFLKLAKKNKKLINLSKNIKKGNSLVSEKSVDVKAFDWYDKEKGFGDILENGGFDVIIGNPPYLRIQGLKGYHENSAKFYENNYVSATSNFDIYVLFMEKSFGLIKDSGKVSFILPHKFMISEFGKGIREFLIKNKAIEKIISFGSNMVFQDASTYTCIVNLSKNNNKINFTEINPRDINSKIDFDDFDYSNFSSDKWDLSDKKSINLLNKIRKQPIKLRDVFPRIFQGIATGADKIFLIKGEEKGNLIKGFSEELQREIEIERGFVKPILKGEDVSKYASLENYYWVIFPYNLKDGKAVSMSEEEIKERFPKGFEYLKKNEKALRKRERGRFDNTKEWFLLSRKQGLNDVEQSKIVTPNFSFGTNMSFDDGKIYHNSNCYSFVGDNLQKEEYKFYLSILNSSLMWFFIVNTSPVLRGGFRQFKTVYLEPFPILKISSSEQKTFIEKADQMLELNKKLFEKKREFIDVLKKEFKFEKISRKLEEFYNLNFIELLKEIEKVFGKIKIDKQLELKSPFEKYKQELSELKSKIDETDKEIDKMVYELYGLTPEEIKIVEDFSLTNIQNATNGLAIYGTGNRKDYITNDGRKSLTLKFSKWDRIVQANLICQTALNVADISTIPLFQKAFRYFS